MAGIKPQHDCSVEVISLKKPGLYFRYAVFSVKYLSKLAEWRPRSRWEDNIKMGLQEVGGGCEDWMELAQDRDRWRTLVSTVMNIRVPKMRGIS